MTNKPVVKIADILKWIECPRKVKFEKYIKEKRYDYKSFLRYMLLSTLRRGYSVTLPGEKLDLTTKSGEIWEFVLAKNHFPSPAGTVRQMSQFYEIRKDIFDKIDSEKMVTVNKFHWWELGNLFNVDYFRRKDEINKYQHLLGFPSNDIVKGYLPEYKYYPVTLADCYADYIDAVKILERRNFAPRNIRFDVPVFLELDDVIVEFDIDIIWFREKVWQSESLPSGFVAENFIYLNQFSSCKEDIASRANVTYDIRYPLVGADYKDQNGEKIRFTGVENLIVSNQKWTNSLYENNYQYKSEEKTAIFNELNRLADTFQKAEKFNLGVWRIAPHYFECASCPYIEECFSPGNPPKDIQRDFRQKYEAAELGEFQDEFSDRLEVCDNRLKAVSLIIDTLEFIKQNNDIDTIQTFSNIAENIKNDFLIERSKNAAAKKKI